MKKMIMLLLALIANLTLNGQTIVITTTELNPAVDGSLLHELSNATSGAIINFDMDGDTLKLSAAMTLKIDNKTLTINGLNKKTGNKVVFKGESRMMDLANNSDLTLNDLVIRDFSNIAFTSSENSMIKATNCEFINNREPMDKKANNGGVFRINASTAKFNKCLFAQNRCAGSYGGGGICAYGAANLRVENCSFYHNEASNGSAITVNATVKNASPKVYIANCTFANNISDNRGGAIYMQTGTDVDVFTPSVINCTFVGNFAQGGAAMCLWSKTSTSMKPIIVNNIFVQNFQLPWSEKEVKYDALLFYGSGDTTPQTVFPISKNNIFESASIGTFTDESNRKVDFANVDIFNSIELNPWENGDPTYNHKTSVLSGPMKVALLSQQSIALNAGIASMNGVEIPAIDALGNPRPSTPSIGAVELAATTGIETKQIITDQLAFLLLGKRLQILGLKTVSRLQIFDMSGRSTLRTTIHPAEFVELNLAPGIYIASINGCRAKIMVR